MSLRNDLNSQVRQIMQERWRIQPSRAAPQINDLELNNHGAIVNGAVLYADLDESTKLVDQQEEVFAAQMYKTYLACAARIISSEQGSITAYDGDRIMAVYTGRRTAERAVRAALKIGFAVGEIINPAIREIHPTARFEMKQSCGVDTSRLLVTRTGPRSANDLVWVGRAANHAAKLSSREAPATHITASVYGQLPEGLKVSRNGSPLWTETTAREINDRRIFTSTARFQL